MHPRNMTRPSKPSTTSALASFLMGLLANLPVGMAPGMGLNAYVGVPPDVQVVPLTLFSCCFLVVLVLGRRVPR